MWDIEFYYPHPRGLWVMVVITSHSNLSFVPAPAAAALWLVYCNFHLLILLLGDGPVVVELPLNKFINKKKKKKRSITTSCKNNAHIDKWKNLI